MASTALEALFDLDPSAAAEIAEKRLDESLSHDCVPAALVKLLVAHRQDPFRALAARLEALGCDRKRLRPERALLSGEESTGELRSAVRAAADGMNGACRKAIEDLFGESKAP